MGRTIRLLLVAAVMVSSARSIARADEGVEVLLQVRAPDPTEPQMRTQAPLIEATIIGASRAPLEKLSLTTTHLGERVTMRATRVRTYIEGSETIAIALVINGQEIWIGNDACEPDTLARYEGVLQPLAQAIDVLKLGGVGPPGSKGLVVSYSTGAEIRVPMGPLDGITGAALGNQCDYRGKIGTDMVQGITMGLAELTKVATARKALIVIGDGSDTNPDVAKAALAQLKADARKANVQLFGIMYKSHVSSPDMILTTLIPTAKVVNSHDGIASELNAVVARMSDRFYVTFPGYDERSKAGLPWDGKDHELVVRSDQTEYEPATIQLAPVWRHATPRSFPWLGCTLAVLGGLAVLALVILIARGGSAPPVVASPPPHVWLPRVEASLPLPMKTVMIGSGGDLDGFPVVGWLVALNGADAYSTKRLKPGLTRIGTAAPSDIVVNDGFMSTDHCKIACSPGGFSLLDAGATNGCFVNDRRVMKHDLVDNDVITLGMTHFKFKTTM